MKLYQQIAQIVNIESRRGKSPDWISDCKKKIKDLLPRGAGIDAGSDVAWAQCRPDRLILNTQFHHMDGNGFYDGWTSHPIIVTPTFLGEIHIRIDGTNRNDIKDYLGEVFQYALTAEWSEPLPGYLKEEW